MHWDIFQRRLSIVMRSRNRWTRKEQSSFFNQLSELLLEGFTLSEVVALMPLFFKKHAPVLAELSATLEEGVPFEQCVTAIGVSESIRSQLFLSMQQGTFAQTCRSIGEYLSVTDVQWRKLRQVLVYPCFLIVFLVGMVAMMRYLLLGELMTMVSVETLEDSPLLYLVWQGFVHLPVVVAGVIVFVAVVTVGIYSYWRRLTPLQRVQWSVRLPVVGKSVQQYYTYLYAQEFSYLLGEGQSLKRMVALLQLEGTSSLTKAVGRAIDAAMQRGETLSVALGQLGFLKEELLGLIVEGEYTHQLDTKLRYYAQHLFREYCESLERKIAVLQPVLFIGVGVVIVAMYLILLLPTLSMIGGN